MEELRSYSHASIFVSMRRVFTARRTLMHFFLQSIELETQWLLTT